MKKYRSHNWKDYNEALVRRGSLTLWFDAEALKEWKGSDKKGQRGRPQEYSDTAILCGLTLKSLYSLTFRATEGFLESLKDLLQLKIKIPDYTLLCKRQKNLNNKIAKKEIKPGEEISLVIDTTGIKVYGEGEWKVRRYGWIKHRLWRKLHLAINCKTQEIESCVLTDLGVQDCEGFSMLLNKIEADVDLAIGDGSYDRFVCYEESEKRNIRLITPPQRNAVTSKERTANKRKGSIEAVRKRDKAIEEVRAMGRKEWKIAKGYHRRSLAETAVHRVKMLMGNRLKTRNFENQKTEIAIWCRAINKMTQLGMPVTEAI